MRPFARASLLPLLLLLPLVARAQQAGPWLAYARAEEAGFSTAKLNQAHRFADSVRSAAVFVVFRGNVLAAWGATDRNLPARSLRKGMVSALMGVLVNERRISLDASLATLGIEDAPPLTTSERAARVRDVIAARSGVYHNAAYASDEQQGARPLRGANAPGAAFFYNNWDFNVAEAMTEQAMGSDVFQSFSKRIGSPIGMEDYDPALGLRVLEPSNSRFPAHAQRISARDLARFGQLYLQGGAWNGTQIIPAEWVQESTAPHSDLGAGVGYGYMWWTYAAGSIGARYPLLNGESLFMGRGSGGEALFVIPRLELVIVHRADADNGRSVAGPAIWQLVEQILGARIGEPDSSPKRRAVSVVAFASQLPAAVIPPFLFLGLDQLTRLAGDYQIEGGPMARVFVHDGKLFINVPGQGETQLFAISEQEFMSLVFPVGLTFNTDSADRTSTFDARIGRQRMRAVRRASP